MIWLRESDEVLERYCSRWDRARLSAHIEFRERCDELAAQRPGRVEVIDVDWSPDNNERWTSMLEVTKRVLGSAPFREALERAKGTWGEASLSDREVSEPFLEHLRRDPKLGKLTARR